MKSNDLKFYILNYFSVTCSVFVFRYWLTSVDYHYKHVHVVGKDKTPSCPGYVAGRPPWFNHDTWR